METMSAKMLESRLEEVKSQLEALSRDPVFQALETRAFRYEVGENAEGNPALWIYVIVPDNVDLTKPQFEARLRLRRVMEQAGWDDNVYTRFRRASEETPPGKAVTLA